MKCEVGCIFGKLKVVKLISDKKNPKAECICDCGTVVIRQRGGLTSGRATNCGCIKREKTRIFATTHGKSQSVAYQVWRGMKSRCDNKKDAHYGNYGARGIQIEWKSFEEFYRDMGDPPSGAMIERKNTNGNYCKDNCEWAGWDIQSTNKRTSKRWVIHGIEYRSSREAAKAIGVDASTINKRVNGRIANGKYYPPMPGYSSRYLYDSDH